MKILLCSNIPLERRLGASKVLIELAEELAIAGCQCQMLQPADLGLPRARTLPDRLVYMARLRDHLIANSSQYDVIDYDHIYLPYKRGLFSQDTVMVARSVLLAQHLSRLRLPSPFSMRSVIGRALRGGQQSAHRRQLIQSADRTVQEADLINVCNDVDRAELLRRGIAGEKIVVIPFGLSRAIRELFEPVSVTTPSNPIVAFVGTFDNRKGALDLPEIFARLAQAVPSVRFLLLGTAGQVQSTKGVLAAFPLALRDRIEVRPRFEPEELPSLLASCSAGVFPSYYEGFGFGVLEMLAAALPVIAYDAPGPPMMLPGEWLASPGDVNCVSDKLCSLLKDANALQQARVRARELSRPFTWASVARTTIAAYERALTRRREHARTVTG